MSRRDVIIEEIHLVVPAHSCSPLQKLDDLVISNEQFDLLDSTRCDMLLVSVVDRLDCTVLYMNCD